MCKPGASCGCGSSGTGAGMVLAAAAVVVTVGAGVVFVADYAALIAGGLAVTAAGTVAVVRLLSRRMVLSWRHPVRALPAVTVVEVRAQPQQAIEPPAPPRLLPSREVT